MKTHKRALLLLMVGAVHACRPACAQERKIRYFADYDYFFRSNSGEGLSNLLHSNSDALLAQGYAATSFSVNTGGGVGTRIGALYPIDGRTKLGTSLGYVIGPNMNSNFSAFSGVFGNGGTTINRSVAYIRLLLESRTSWAISRRWDFNLGSGWGGSYGKIEQSCTSSGSLTCPVNSTKRSWAGFTWEFSPGFSYRLRSVSVDFGVRYAGFPKFKGNDDIAAIEWQTFGLFLGASF